MRLIDADALRYKAETCLETTEDFQDLIDSQPTVKAITKTQFFSKLKKMCKAEMGLIPKACTVKIFDEI